MLHITTYIHMLQHHKLLIHTHHTYQNHYKANPQYLPRYPMRLRVLQRILCAVTTHHIKSKCIHML